MKEKLCKACKEVLSIESFAPNKNLKDGYENKCRKCRQNQRKKNHKHICEGCGVEFNSAKPKAKYCSHKCHGKTRDTKVDKKCVVCKKQYKTNNKKSKYCSIECRNTGFKESFLGEKNPNFNSMEIKCTGCNKKILRNYSRIENNIFNFCSHKCYKKNIGKHRVKELVWNYDTTKTDEERQDKRQYKDYENWREQIFQRDSYTCRSCGDAKGGNLVAHHLYGYSKYKELRTELSNGITLCNKCHKDFHKKFGYGNNTKEQFEIYQQNK